MATKGKVKDKFRAALKIKPRVEKEIYVADADREEEQEYEALEK